MEDFEQLEIRAKGEFIIFIDGDDFIEPNYLEELYHVSLKNNSEVVIGSYKQFNEEDTKYYIHIFDYREENYINKELIEKTVKQFHWAGRNSRGVTQVESEALDKMLKDKSFSNVIDKERAKEFIDFLLRDNT